MTISQGEFDFLAIIAITSDNINSNPSNGNRSYENYDGYDIFADVTIKRKMRNHIQDTGGCIVSTKKESKQISLAFKRPAMS